MEIQQCAAAVSFGTFAAPKVPTSASSAQAPALRVGQIRHRHLLPLCRFERSREARLHGNKEVLDYARTDMMDGWMDGAPSHEAGEVLPFGGAWIQRPGGYRGSSFFAAANVERRRATCDIADVVRPGACGEVVGRWRLFGYFLVVQKVTNNPSYNTKKRTRRPSF